MIKMQLVRDKISVNELKPMAEKMYGNLVKAVVDIVQEIMIVDAGLHADEEFCLLEEHDSQQENLWGINLFPDKFGTEDFIVFDSMINIRPREGNRTRGVEDPKIQARIRAVVNKLVVS